MYDPPPHNNENAGPPAPPLPLGEVVRRLPSIYWRIFTRPSAATFAEEVGWARWDVVWTQLLGMMILSLIYTVLWQQFFMPRFIESEMLFTFGSTPGFSSSSIPNPFPLQAVQNIERIVFPAIIVLYPAWYFLLQGLYYLCSRLFHGQGTFLVQCHVSTLANGPFTLVATACGLLMGLVVLSPAAMVVALPLIWLLNLGVTIYFYVLQIMAMMAAHRLNAMNAAGVMLLPLVALFLLGIILGIILAVVLIYFVMSHIG